MAGPGRFQFAAGADYRAEDFNFTPDAAYNALQLNYNVVNNIALPVGVNGKTLCEGALRRARHSAAVRITAGHEDWKSIPATAFRTIATVVRKSTWKITG